MENVLGFLKWLLIAVVVGAILYVLYKVLTGIGSIGDRISQAWNSLKRDASSVQSTLTPGWSSIVPTVGNMPQEMADRYAQIKAAEPNLNTENPNLPWYQRAFSVHNFFGFDLAPATSIKTPQTVGSSAEQYNIGPYAISTLTPNNQPGTTALGDTLTTGAGSGTTGSNIGPVVGSLPQVRGVTLPDVDSQTPQTTMNIQNTSTVTNSDVDTSQLQFLGQ